MVENALFDPRLHKSRPHVGDMHMYRHSIRYEDIGNLKTLITPKTNNGLPRPDRALK